MMGGHHEQLNPVYRSDVEYLQCPSRKQVVGTVPANQEVQLMDGSLLRDWVFVGKPGPDGVSPRGWVIYAGLGQCQ